MHRIHSRNILLPLLVLLGTLLFTILAIFGTALRGSVIGENSVPEVLTALGYLAGTLTAFYYLVKLPKAAKYTAFALLWAITCFVFFGEETSWLQHLLGYRTPPSIEAKNLQGEFNFHNIDGFMTVASRGSVHQAVLEKRLDLSGLLSAQNLFRLGFLSYFVLFPLALYGLIRLKVLEQRWVKALFPLPSLGFVASVVLVIGVSVLAYVINPEARKEITEMREMFYALFILFYVYAYLPRSAGQPATPARA